jgi:hypothetical protein
MSSYLPLLIVLLLHYGANPSALDKASNQLLGSAYARFLLNAILPPHSLTMISGLKKAGMTARWFLFALLNYVMKRGSSSSLAETL